MKLENVLLAYGFIMGCAGIFAYVGWKIHHWVSHWTRKNRPLSRWFFVKEKEI